MLMAYKQLVDMIDAGIITHVNIDQVNSASIDIRLGDVVELEACYTGPDPEIKALYEISLEKRQPLRTRTHIFSKDGPLKVYPGECFLAHSRELFNLPNNLSAMFKLKSSCGRIFLEHMNAGWCDAGWHGSALTMEFKNNSRNHVIVLEGGEKIGQMVFFSHEMVPADKSYAVRGRYNKDKIVSGTKPAIVFGEEQEEIAQAVFEEAQKAVPEVVSLDVDMRRNLIINNEE
jgi:deoxycytidine triphosphate deaminase